MFQFFSFFEGVNVSTSLSFEGVNVSNFSRVFSKGVANSREVR